MPDVGILAPREQQHVGALGGTAGAADLLVVGNRRGRSTEMDHEAEVRLVESHAERARGDQRFELVVLELTLQLFALVGVRTAGVGTHLMTGLAQESSGVLGSRHRERVDDAAARHVAQMAQQPAEAGTRVGQLEHAEPQGRTGEGSADRQHLPSSSELFGDVDDDSLVGRRRGGEHREIGRQGRDELGETAVVGAEVVAPVGDAVGLVDDQHSHTGDQVGQLLIAKARVVEPFGRDQQDVDFVGGELGAASRPTRAGWPS